MKFLQRFWNTWKNIFNRKGCPPTLVAESETLTRFIFNSKHYDKEKNEAEFAAFVPPKNMETSVFRTINLFEFFIHYLGKFVEKLRNERARKRNRPLVKLRARANVLTKDVTDLNLRVESETSIHHLHANIINWKSQKSFDRLLALEIAKKSKLRVY